jgi:2-oxoglutarate/2-oxoacid ferredoxin oxidoreductase subunit alpha
MTARLMKGNEAVAEAAVAAGCRYYFGYPITPQNEIPEYLSWRLAEVDGVFIQAESEIAAINMVYGASSAGARVMTSSSGPGISLKSEGLSYLAGSQLPAVIINMMRGGPGLGGIQPSQSDYFQATKGGGHGDYRLLVLAPATVQELYDLTRLAFDLADRYRNPVMLLGDGLLGQMMEKVELEEDPPIPAAIPKPWAATGCRGRQKNIVNSLYLDPHQLEEHNLRLQEKYRLITENETRFEGYRTEDSEILLVAYGTMARVAKGAVDAGRAKGIKAGLFRPITLWPFPYKSLQETALGAKALLTAEMSSGQMVEDVRLALEGRLPVHFYGRMGGVVPGSQEVLAEIERIWREIS